MVAGLTVAGPRPMMLSRYPGTKPLMIHDPILVEVEPLATLLGVLRWAQARTPTAEIIDVVAQDELTFDVIVRAGAGLFLAFDTT